MAFMYGIKMKTYCHDADISFSFNIVNLKKISLKDSTFLGDS